VLAHAIRLALIVVILAACSRDANESRYSRRGPVEVPPEIATLAIDALRAASEIKVSGDADAVLGEHERSPRYAEPMAKHFALMRQLHQVGVQSRIRYPRSSVTVRHDQFCEKGQVAHLVVTAMVRYDMEAIPPATGSPHYTAGQEEHVFRFERRDGAWVMADHHEINLEEMHQKEVVTRLRNPCSSAQ
jgi:hypothetical protein